MNERSQAMRPSPPRKRIGDILVTRGVLSRAHLDDALKAQGSSLLPLGSTLIRMGLLPEREVALALAEQFGLPAVHISASTISTAVLDVVPKEVAARHRLLPLAFSGANALKLGIANPDEKSVIDEITFASGRSTLAFVVPRLSLERAISAAYESRSRGEAFWKGPEGTAETSTIMVIQSEPSPSPQRPIEPEVSVSALDEFPAAPQPAPRNKDDQPRILAVDDEPEILEILSLSLGRRGFEVMTATRGRQAMDLLRTYPPDLVLLDAMLPEIHGFELCQHIKRSEHYRSIPVIMISAIYTGWNFSQDVRRIYGADDYIEKPFSLKEVLHRVDQALSKAGNHPKAPEAERAQRDSVRFTKHALDQLQAGDTAAAVAAAERAVDMDPFEPRAHFVLASAMHASDRFYEAISSYERVIELAPDQFSALKNLAVLYERQGFKAKAVEMWMRALENSPTDAVRQTIKAHLVDLL
ncbi:MAG: response regulator [Myxococcales bacterium]|nr:response regulator [Myxococcales bacterium]